jgi:type IV pilus assembly protein PilN
MKDLNFFKPYLGKKQQRKNSNRYIYGVMVIVVISIIVTFAINTTQIVLLDRSISSYNEKLSASEIQTQLKEAENINSKISVLKKYETALTDVAISVKKRDNVSDTLLNEISGTLPSEVSFKTLNVTENTVTMQGTSTNRTAVAELKHNLSELPIMKDVYVNSIDTQSAVEGEYSFDINCVLKDVG